MQVKRLKLTHTSGLLGWVKRSDIEKGAEMYILVEPSNLIGVDYDWSDTQGEMGFIFKKKNVVNILSS